MRLVTRVILAKPKYWFDQLALENGLREHAIPASDAIRAQPEGAISLGDMRSALTEAYNSYLPVRQR
jgi:hypothetical protein